MPANFSEPATPSPWTAIYHRCVTKNIGYFHIHTTPKKRGGTRETAKTKHCIAPHMSIFFDVKLLLWGKALNVTPMRDTGTARYPCPSEMTYFVFRWFWRIELKVAECFPPFLPLLIPCTYRLEVKPIPLFCIFFLKKSHTRLIYIFCKYFFTVLKIIFMFAQKKIERASISPILQIVFFSHKGLPGFAQQMML